MGAPIHGGPSTPSLRSVAQDDAYLVISKCPQQVPTPSIHRLRIRQSVQIAGYITNQQSTLRKCTRPVVEMSLERSPAVSRLHRPVPDLDLLLDGDDARNLQDEPRLGERLLENDS